MNDLTLKDKVYVFFACACLVLVVTLLNCEGRKRYRLPNGDVVTCGSMVETSKGNFHLSDCDSGTEYWITGVVELLK